MTDEERNATPAATGPLLDGSIIKEAAKRINRGASALAICAALANKYQAELDRLREQARELERMVSLEMNQAIEIGTLKTNKHFLEHELAATVEELDKLRAELADYVAYAIGMLERDSRGNETGEKHELGRQRYRELTGREYGEGDSDE